MDDTALELNRLIEKALEVVEKCGIRPSAIELNYKAPFGRINRFRNGLEGPFSADMLEDYATHIEQLFESGTWSKHYYFLNRHAAPLLLDCAKEKEPIWRQYRKDRHRYTPDEKHIALTESVLASIGPISNSHATRTRRYLRQFFCYMEEVGADEWSMGNECIRRFIIDVVGNQPKEAGYIIYSLRVLINYLTERGICDISIDPALYNPPIKGHPPIPAFTQEEVRRMLDTVDDSTDAGKRSKAIILLAITTGLRGCDIAALRLTEIDWTKEEILITQKKTLAPIAAPLVSVAGNALTDYLLNSRPQSKDDHVFLTLRAPYHPITSAGTFDTMLEGICAKAGIEEVRFRAFHSLRRPAGTWMAQAEVPVETIAQVLGHTNIRSSMPYIAFDPVTLDACPLDFTCIPLAKGGVYVL